MQGIRILNIILSLCRRFRRCLESCEFLHIDFRWWHQLLIISSAAGLVLFGSSCCDRCADTVVGERKEATIQMAIGKGFFRKEVLVRQRDYIVDHFYVGPTENINRKFDVITGIDITFYEVSVSKGQGILPLGSIASGYWEMHNELEVDLCSKNGLVYKAKR